MILFSCHVNKWTTCKIWISLIKELTEYRGVHRCTNSIHTFFDDPSSQCCRAEPFFSRLWLWPSASGKKYWFRLHPENLSSDRRRLRKTNCKNLFRQCPRFWFKTFENLNFNSKASINLDFVQKWKILEKIGSKSLNYYVFHFPKKEAGADLGSR